MDLLEARQIVNADRMSGGMIIKFDDGRCAFYSSALLYETLPKCEELNESDLIW